MMIIVAGLPGSGKSYFASRLSEILGAQTISSDQTRKAMNATGRYTFEEKLKVYEEMAKVAADAIRQGKTVVVDATFYRHEMRDLFMTLAKLLHKPICYFEVEADEKIVQDRLSKPRMDSEADYQVYKQLKPQYEKPEDGRLVLQSTNDNVEAMLLKALDHIKRINEGNAD
jgi:predicted kinase